MSATKTQRITHIPGSYSLIDCREYQDYPSPEIHILGPQRPSGGEPVLATVLTKNIERLGGDPFAQASLFAASSDLLEACERVIRELDGGDELTIGCIEDLKDAIARGRK